MHVYTLSRFHLHIYMYTSLHTHITQQYVKVLEPDVEIENGKLGDYNHWVKIIILNLVTISLWASVAIGVSGVFVCLFNYMYMCVCLLFVCVCLLFMCVCVCLLFVCVRVCVRACVHNGAFVLMHVHVFTCRCVVQLHVCNPRLIVSLGDSHIQV